MIQIYCLVDPFTHIPFYVGATKLSLAVRLNQHITGAAKFKDWLKYSHNELKHFPFQRKNVIINLLANSNRKPLITCLIECPLYMVDHYEQFFYEMFKKQGFYMHQEAKKFKYHSTTITKSNRCTSLTIFNKNNSNIIW